MNSLGDYDIINIQTVINMIAVLSGLHNRFKTIINDFNTKYDIISNTWKIDNNTIIDSQTKYVIFQYLTARELWIQEQLETCLSWTKKWTELKNTVSTTDVKVTGITSQNQCAQICLNDPKCEGIAWTTAGSVCSLYNSALIETTTSVTTGGPSYYSYS
jgi:hypothetical protein